MLRYERKCLLFFIFVVEIEELAEVWSLKTKRRLCSWERREFGSCSDKGNVRINENSIIYSVRTWTVRRVVSQKVTSHMSDQYDDIYCFRKFHFSRRKTCELKGQLMGLVEEVSSLVEQSENLGGKCLLKFSLRWRGIILVDHVHVELPRVQHDCSIYTLLG